MQLDQLNFRHLHYFWAVAQAGSITKAAQQLGVSIQTISTQLSQLERQLGQALFAPQGRGLQLTEAGQTALGYAEQIFALGDKLCQALADPSSTCPRFAVGITDAVPKLTAFRLLKPLLHAPLSVRLVCCENDFEPLLSELALNRLDLVIADRSAPEQANWRFTSTAIAKVDVAWYGSLALQQGYAEGFPHSLDGAPVLLPSKSNPLRYAIDAWFHALELRPLIIGEFSDSALLKTFGRAGLALFPAPHNMADDLQQQYGVYPVGVLTGVQESCYLIHAPRQLQHPAITYLCAQSQFT